MLKLDGYKINSLIYESSNTSIYRALREKDKNPVILKFLKKEYPTPEQIKQFRYEYDIVKDLNINGVIKNHDIINYKNTMAIIMEDIGGESLDKIIKKSKLNLKPFLTIAIKLSEILDQVHKQNLIHKDIKPHNVIINSKTGEIKLIDFSISTKLKKKNQSIVNPEQLEGTLAYISPEQTGRMNRSIDYRSDFYSLGIMFYEMVTGKRPFESKDPMEIVHFHIAVIPPTPYEIDKNIPKVISDIIMKLINKNAEDRYQSTFGLLSDLKKCYTQIKDKGKITDFEIAKNDISENFHIPEKLYGRENEVKLLMQIFQKISDGNKELLFFKGSPGIGKSALINEIHKPIVKKHGFFISGKYDQFKKNIPYTAIIQAFQEITRQIITENEVRLQYWKDKILKAVGNIGQVIIDVIPEIELIIGKQPDIPELPSAEAQNRFNMVFQNFIKVFADKKHPLIFFLDDLQWADNASLNLLEVILNDPELIYLFFIGSFRDNEVDPAHPFITMLENIKKQGIKWDEIKIEPLKEKDVNNLISETVKDDPSKTKEFAKLIINKTGGNPFFVKEFLKSLYDEKLIEFDNKWKWDLKKIKQANVTDNVVDLMAGKIQRLPENTLNVLKIASCIGVKFYMNTLSDVYGKKEEEVFTELIPALNEGMIMILDDENAKFTHDRVREAAYSIINEKEKKQIHYKIGKVILKRPPEQCREDRLFSIANQLNLVKDILTDQEKKELININLQAGQKAKASAAFESARMFFKNGMELLSDDSWKTDYDLSLKIYTELSEAEYMCSNFEEAEKLFDLILKKSNNLLEKIEIYELKISMYTTQMKLLKAISLGITALKKIGLKIPKNPKLINIIPEIMFKTEPIIKNKNKESIIKIKKLNNQKKEAIIRILYNLCPTALFIKPNLALIFVMKILQITLKNGLSVFSSFAFVSYGIILAGILGKYNRAYELANIGIELANSYNNKKISSVIYHHYTFFDLHWKKHEKYSFDYNLKGIEFALESGNIDFVSYNIIWICIYPGLFLGKNLLENENTFNKYENLLIKMDQQITNQYIYLFKELVLKLQGKEVDNKLIGNIKDKNFLKQQWEKNNVNANLFAFYLIEALYNFYFKNYNQAFENIVSTEKYSSSALGSFHHVNYQFFYTLILFDNIIINPQKRKKHLKKIENFKKAFKKYSESCPENYEHKYLLIRAEYNKIIKNNLEAMKLYDKTIKSAKKNSYLNIEAIANERASNFYHSIGIENVAKTYMREAHYCYVKWGATAKINQLEEKYPYLLEKISYEEHGDNMSKTISETMMTTVSSSSSGTGSTSKKFLDFNTVMKATQAISGEIEMKALLENMIKILIENAGAQKGALILNQDEKYYIQAESDITNNSMKIMESIELDKAKTLSSSIIRFVIMKREAQILDNAADDDKFANDPYIIEKKPKSILCTPVINKGKLVGILYLENNISTGTFTPARVEVLNILSAQAAISIENAKLIENMKDRERLKSEMQIAERIQTSLVPVAPEHPELDIAAVMQPAEEVGGDYYDILFDKNNALWVAIGDVSGHGVTPGLIMMMAETSFNTDVIGAEGKHTPKDAIIKVNRILTTNIRERLHEKHFMTMTFFKYTGNGTFLHSGVHVDIIIYRSKTKKCEVIKTDGIYLGIKKNIESLTKNESLKLEKNDVLVLYTDGVIESRHKDDKRLLGLDALIDIIIKNGSQNSDVIKNAIVKKAMDWCAGKPDDDITTVVIKRTK